jgi:hypothetical protein
LEILPDRFAAALVVNDDARSLRWRGRRAAAHGLAVFYEAGNPADQFTLEQWRVSLVGNFDQVHFRAPRAHGCHRCRRKQVGIRTANDQHWHAGKRIEFVPQSGHGPLDVDPGERASDAEIVSGLERAMFEMPSPPRPGEPLIRCQFGKLRT